MLKDERKNIADALGELGKFGALAADSVNRTKENLVKELKDLGPVLQSLADAGPALTRSLGFFATFPFPKHTLSKWIRGDYGNLTAVIDLTLSRIDTRIVHRHPMGGQPDRTRAAVGANHRPDAQPATPPGNPLVAPYHFDQGPDMCDETNQDPVGRFRDDCAGRDGAMMFGYIQIQSTIFGVDRYPVTVQLPQSGGLYPGGNVTYRGVEIGRVEAVRLTKTGAEAVASDGL